MLTIVKWFIAVSLTLQFLGSFVETWDNTKPAAATDYIETIWNALIILAFAYYATHI